MNCDRIFKPSAGISDTIMKLCTYYRGENSNPYDVTSTIPDERKIEFLRYHLWDVEHSVSADPDIWRKRMEENNGTVPANPEDAARAIYDFAVTARLESLSAIGIDLRDIYIKIKDKAGPCL